MPDQEYDVVAQSAGFEARDVLRPQVGYITYVILAGHCGPIDERALAYCKELHAAGEELVDKLGRFMDLARLDTGKVERDGEIVSLESALERGWF